MQQTGCYQGYDKGFCNMLLSRQSASVLLRPHQFAVKEGTVFACRVVKYWTRLPLAVASVPEQPAFKRQLDTYIYP